MEQRGLGSRVQLYFWDAGHPEIVVKQPHFTVKLLEPDQVGWMSHSVLAESQHLNPEATPPTSMCWFSRLLSFHWPSLEADQRCSAEIQYALLCVGAGVWGLPPRSLKSGSA